MLTKANERPWELCLLSTSENGGLVAMIQALLNSLEGLHRASMGIGSGPMEAAASLGKCDLN